MVRRLKPYVATWRLVRPDSDSALDQNQLAEEVKVSGSGVRVELYGDDYERCLRELFEDCGGSQAFVTGSMYMVGRFREMLSIPQRAIWNRLSNR